MELHRGLEHRRALALGVGLGRRRRRAARPLRSLFLLTLVACKSDKPAPPAPVVIAIDAAVKSPATVTPAKLPGELWFVDDGPPRRLVRIVDGAASTVPTDGDIYPSAFRADDGRIVALSSHGDGRADGEQLVLLDARGTIEPLGPAATQVRSPAVGASRSWVVAAYTDNGVSNLRRIELASRAVTQLTTQPQGNFTPAPVGRDAVVFVSSRDGDSEIYLARGTPSGERRLTAFHKEDWDPSASLDGTQIAFVSNREQGVARIFMVAADGTGTHRLTTREDPAVEEGAVVWSPDKRRLAYTVTSRGVSHVVVREISSGTERELGIATEPAFSPDGAWIAVARPGVLEVVSLADPAAATLTIARGAVHLPRWY